MRLLLLALVLAYSQTCLASAFPTLDAAKAQTDKIMKKVATGDIEAGLKMIKPYSVVPAAEFDAMVGQTKLQLPVITQRFGKSLGSEYINEDKVGNSLVRLTYLHRYEKHAMRWLFFLYHGKDGWVINTFKFDDQIHQLFPH